MGVAHTALRTKVYAKVSTHRFAKTGYYVLVTPGTYVPATDSYTGSSSSQIAAAAVFDVVSETRARRVGIDEIKPGDRMAHLVILSGTPERDASVVLDGTTYTIITSPIEESADSGALYIVWLREQNA